MRTLSFINPQVLQNAFIPATALGLYVQWTPGHQLQALRDIREQHLSLHPGAYAQARRMLHATIKTAAE